MFYKWLIRPVFFLYSPERSHYIAMSLLTAIKRIPIVSHFMFGKKIKKGITLMGLHFENRVGLAAGF
ncbi:MAG: dihydroorotate dehydrogenase (quinone), partial [Flavobacteriales bacterium]